MRPRRWARGTQVLLGTMLHRFMTEQMRVGGLDALEVPADGA